MRKTIPQQKNHAYINTQKNPQQKNPCVKQYPNEKPMRTPIPQQKK